MLLKEFTIMAGRVLFTLIELLFVITIITVLASLLLPVLKQVKEKGKGISCLSNLKQLGLHIQTYTLDYNYNLPVFSQPIEEGRIYWPALLMRTVDASAKLFWCPSKINPDYEKLFYKTATRKWVETNPTYAGLHYPAYGYNDGLAYNPTGVYTGNFLAAYPRLNAMRKPSSTFLFADGYCRGYPNLGYYIIFGTYGESGGAANFDARHAQYRLCGWPCGGS